MVAGELKIGSDVDADIRDILMVGTTLKCESDKCVLQHIQTDTSMIIKARPTIRFIKSSAQLLDASSANLKTELEAGKYLKGVDSGTDVIPGTKENDLVAYAAGLTDEDVAKFLDPDDTTVSLDDMKAACVGTKYFLHVGSRLDKDIQQFGAIEDFLLEEFLSEELAFGFIIVDGIKYKCESLLSSPFPDSNADRELKVQTEKMHLTVTLKEDGSIAAADGKLLLNNIDNGGRTERSDTAKIDVSLDPIVLGMAFDTHRIRMEASGSPNLVVGRKDKPVIVSSDEGMLGRRCDIVCDSSNLSGSSMQIRMRNDTGTTSIKDVFDAYGSSKLGTEANDFITIDFELLCSDSMFATFNGNVQMKIYSKENGGTRLEADSTDPRYSYSQYTRAIKGLYDLSRIPYDAYDTIEELEKLVAKDMASELNNVTSLTAFLQRETLLSVDLRNLN